MITSYQTTRLDDVTQVAVVSSLTGEVFYHWYLDGMYMGATAANTRSFQLPPGSQAEIEVADTLDPAFDPLSFTPAAPPARKTLWWVRSTATNIKKYRIEQQENAGDWTFLADVLPTSAQQWDFFYTTPRLDDLAAYAWRITPFDIAGNAGAPITFAAETCVRRPDAPRFAAAFNPSTLWMTFSNL
jgi:hypothetical protein